MQSASVPCRNALLNPQNLQGVNGGLGGWVDDPSDVSLSGASSRVSIMGRHHHHTVFGGGPLGLTRRLCRNAARRVNLTAKQDGGTRARDQAVARHVSLTLMQYPRCRQR